MYLLKFEYLRQSMLIMEVLHVRKTVLSFTGK